MTATATRPSSRKDPDVVLDRDREPVSGATGSILQVPLELIDVDANVRVNVESIDELAASIREHGVRQPISLRDIPGDRYAINFGQRRFLASKLAERATIPAFVDNEARTPAELAIHQLIENLARQDLPPLDTARAMRAVVDAGMTQVDLARQLGLGDSTVTNSLRLLTASAKVQAALEAGQITASHAKALLPLPASEQDDFVGRIRATNMTTHQLEQEVGWKLQTIRGKEAAAARTVKQAPKLVAALGEAKVSKSTQVRIRAPYNMDEHALGAALKKAGWTQLAYGYASERGSAAKCDCDLVIAEFSRSWKVEPGCIEPKHRDRQNSYDNRADDLRRKAIQDKVQRLKVAIAEVLALTVPEPVVRLMAARGYNDLPHAWEGTFEDATGKAARNLAQIADSTYAYGTKDRETFDGNLDEAVAAFELLAGIQPPAPAEPKPDRTAAAPDEPAFGQLVVDGETKYRISKVNPHALQLALEHRQWRNQPIVAVAQPSKLKWDAEAKAWTGPIALAEEQSA